MATQINTRSQQMREAQDDGLYALENLDAAIESGDHDGAVIAFRAMLEARERWDKAKSQVAAA